MGILQKGLLLVGILTVVQAMSQGGPITASCPQPALPKTIRVWAIPDSLYKAGPPGSGFLVDLLEAIKGITKIPYTLTPKPKLTFGNQDKQGSFAGSLIGALVANEADLVGTDITITSARDAAADFLHPLIQYDLKIVFNSKTGLTPDVQYTIMDNADLQFLKLSKNKTLNDIYKNIEAGRPDSIIADNDNAGAVAKVVSGNFAYVGESIHIASSMAENPAIMESISVQPGSLGTFYEALAVQKGSPLRGKLNSALLKLAESGVLGGLQSKYGLNI